MKHCCLPLGKSLVSAGASRHVCVHGQAVSRVRPSVCQLTPVREAEELLLTQPGWTTAVQ